MAEPSLSRVSAVPTLAALVNGAMRDPCQVVTFAHGTGLSVIFRYPCKDQPADEWPARIVTPHFVTDGYFGGYDHYREDYRSFRYERIVSFVALIASPKEEE